MPTRADMPSRRSPAAPTAVVSKRKRHRRHHCPNRSCHRTVYLPRYACWECWGQLPGELQQRIKAVFPPPPEDQPLAENHPFRIASREARAIWDQP